MKIRIALVICILAGLIYCQNRFVDDYPSHGKITGQDMRMCICCGGWQIVIDNETYNFDSIPANSNINLQKETFPLLVKLDWQLAGPARCQKWINILRIKKE